MPPPADIILGAGVTGLAAGIASGCPVYEREPRPGGICSSYYMRPGATAPAADAGADGEAFRFEHGGGHWIFGGHPDVLAIVDRLAPCARIARRSSVFFPAEQRYVGFPLQHHLRELAPGLAATALAQMLAPPATPLPPRATMREWMEQQFGPALCEHFFAPFHDAYTAGLWREIAPQDGYKTPLDREQVIRGAREPAAAAGYNVSFLYPEAGLDALIGALAARAELHFGHDVVRVDPAAREVTFADGRTLGYRRLLSTLPLNRMLELTGLAATQPAAPYTSVLVLNVGARRGRDCSDDHWLYLPRTNAGFHRVGFYSNVAEHFLPASDRGRGTAVCLYVERSFRGGEKPDAESIARYADAVVAELRGWGFIGEVDALDPSWVDVAYTWNRPGSTWASEAIGVLAAQGIRMAGRYARWNFQGITDSLRDGFLAGQALKLGAG
jgi:protoporphyrinogen oxidase